MTNESESKYYSRKFILSLLVIFSATGLLVGGFLPASIYATLVGGSLTVYTIGNVTQNLNQG